MKTEFAFFYIKDLTVLDNKQNYLDSINNSAKNKISELNNIVYNGEIDRIGKYQYYFSYSTGEYSIFYQFDTFDKIVSLTTTIESKESNLDSENYDANLEILKITLKNIMIKDWKTCYWILDDQTEKLSSDLYTSVFSIENKLRAFVNKVLTNYLGPSWHTTYHGFKKVHTSYKKSSVEFKQRVKEFANIDDTLLSITMETLADIIFCEKIYEIDFELTERENLKIHEAINNNNGNSLIETIKSARKVKVNLWEDVFSNYFKEEFKELLTHFIKNRNHIAHNKLLTLSAANKIKTDNQEIEEEIVSANSKFDAIRPSFEQIETHELVAQYEEEQQNHLEYMIKEESGVDIRNDYEILELFNEYISNIYYNLDDNEYFNVAISLTSLKPLELYNEQNHELFKVICNADKSFNVVIVADVIINDDMGETSQLTLKASSSDKAVITESDINYYNGCAKLGEYGIYEPFEESYIDDPTIEDFENDLNQYIESELNQTKAKVDSLAYEIGTEVGDPIVADFPCYNCGKEYISLDENIYQYGKCINCGEENDIVRCVKCDGIFPIDETNGDLCNNCIEKIKNE